MMRVLVYEPVVQGRLLPYDSGTADLSTAGGTGHGHRQYRGNRNAVAAIQEEIGEAAAKGLDKGGAQHAAVGTVGGVKAAGSRSVAEAVQQELVAAAKEHQQEQQEQQDLAAEPAGPLEGGGKQVRGAGCVETSRGSVLVQLLSWVAASKSVKAVVLTAAVRCRCMAAMHGAICDAA